MRDVVGAAKIHADTVIAHRGNLRKGLLNQKVIERVLLSSPTIDLMKKVGTRLD